LIVLQTYTQTKYSLRKEQEMKEEDWKHRALKAELVLAKVDYLLSVEHREITALVEKGSDPNTKENNSVALYELERVLSFVMEARL